MNNGVCLRFLMEFLGSSLLVVSDEVRNLQLIRYLSQGILIP